MAENGNGSNIKVSWVKLLSLTLTALFAVSWFVIEGYMTKVDTLVEQKHTADSTMAIILKDIDYSLKDIKKDGSRSDSLITDDIKKIKRKLGIE